MNLKSTTTNGFNFRIINSLMECWGVRVDYEYSPIFLRDSRASETRSRAKITPRGKRLHAAGIFLSPRRVSPFLAWGDFHARSRFARSTLPEEKWGTTLSLGYAWPGLTVKVKYDIRFCRRRRVEAACWEIGLGATWDSLPGYPDTEPVWGRYCVYISTAIPQCGCTVRHDDRV